jgi:hypothetical protein
MAISRLYFDHIEIQYRDETGKPTLRALDQNVVSIPIEMLLVKVNKCEHLKRRLFDLIRQLTYDKFYFSLSFQMCL